MNQEQILVQRDELVRENHLGELELYCTPMTFRGRAILGAVSLGLIVAVVGPLVFTSGAFHVFSLLQIALLIAILVGVACLFPVVSSLQDRGRSYVYVYTGGLVCLGRDTRRIVCWENICKVGRKGDSRNGYFYVELNDNTIIRFPEFRSRGSASSGALQKFIGEKMAFAEKPSDQ